MKFIVNLLLFFLCSSFIFAQQNYTEYYQLINKAEDDFVAKNDKSKCYQTYDQAFKKVKKPFVKDYFIASQIAYYNGDTAKFLEYTASAFDAGMTFVCLHNPGIFKSIFTNENLVKQLEHLYKKRKVIKIDEALRDTIYKRYHLMELAKDSGAYDKSFDKIFDEMELSNTNYYLSFLKKGQFPSEQMIGLFTDENYAAFLSKYQLKARVSPFAQTAKTKGVAGISFGAPIPDDYPLWNSAAFVSFLHYPCAFERNKEIFWTAVLNGFVHPKDYGMLEEWVIKTNGNANFMNDCQIQKSDYYYNINRELVKTDDAALVQIERNRKEKLMQTYALDVIKKKMEQEKGFKFFFGFMKSR